MSKSSSVFSGMKLTEQTASVPSAAVDQRLFSSPPPATSSPPAPVAAGTQEGGKPGNQETGKMGGNEVGKEASLPARRERGQVFDIASRPYRKNSFLFTDEELEALEDLKTDLRRKFDVRATKNDLVRCAVHHLIEDFRRLGDASLALRRLKSRRGQ